MTWDEALVWLLNALGVVLAGACVLFPIPAVMIACALVPWAALLVTSLLRKGPMGFWARRRDGPNLILTFLLPALGLAIPTYGNSNFVGTGTVMILAGGVSIVLTSVVYALHYRQLTPDVRALLATFLFGGVYGLGVVSLADTIGDNTVIETYSSVVAGFFPAGKGGAWFLVDGTAPRFGKLTGKIKTGQRVCIDVHPGNLKLRWYDLHNCAEGRGKQT